MTQTRSLYLAILLVLILAGSLRVVLVYLQTDQLQQDRDAYLAIAHNLATGHGYSSSMNTETNEIQPTAFRPPLYPCLLAVIYYLKAAPVGIGIAQIFLGILTVWLTWQTAKCLEMEVGGIFAAAIVATDPVLLQYTAYAMTEVLASFLSSLLLYFLISSFSAEKSPTDTKLPFPISFWAGIVWGAAILCRPTYLAFFGVWIAARLTSSLLQRFHIVKTQSSVKQKSGQISYLTLGIILAVSPWLIRNLVVFHSPILTTTHGGYTLLLGNNPVFYQEVVQKPWGTVWSGKSLHTWQTSLEEQITQQVPAIKSEQERDRWMYQRAKQNISEQPEQFVQSCILRFKRFWNVSPLTHSTLTAKPLINWSIAGYYSLVLIGCFGGIFMVIWNKEKKWAPLVLLIFSFTLVHLFYWTNMRMRAPLVPAIALLSIYGWSQIVRFFKFARPSKASQNNLHNNR